MNLNREQIVKFVLLKRPVKSAVTTINNQELHDLCTDLLSAMDTLEFYGDESNYEWLIGMDNGAKARECVK